MIQQQNKNYNDAYSDSDQEYDLATEKKRIAEGTEEVKKELIEKWHQRYANAQIFPQRISGMSSGLISFLLSFQNTVFYDSLEEQFSLSPEQRHVLPHIVWTMCLNKTWDDIGNLIQKNLNTDFSKINQLAQLIHENIILKAQELSKESQTNKQIQDEIPVNKTVRISIESALKQIPEVSEQLLTTDHIQIQYFKEPVRPSVKNWLSDYTFHLGYKSHNTTIRGNYLFQTENTKNLSYLDRQKLSQILKSFDEKTPLEIDMQTKKIIFSQPLPERKPVPTPTNVPASAPPQQTEYYPAKNTAPIEQKSHEMSPRTSSDISAKTDIPVPRPVYQPKTQEPGNNFEKVIQLEEKNDETSFSSNQRVVNLKEQEKERPTLPTPPVKNLLNIKELIGISRNESQNMPLKPTSAPKVKEIPLAPRKEEQGNVSDRFNLQKITEKANQDSEKPLSAANNSIHHDYSPALSRAIWKNNTTYSPDETKKKLVKSNNTAASPISGASAKDFSQIQKKDNSNIQFSSPQKLPHEKEQEEIQKKPVISEKPQVPVMQPYRIHPASFEDN
jgi:hypothetical protein